MELNHYFFISKKNKFIFSSELTGIANITKSSISEDALIKYLIYSYIPSPSTIFKDIKKLNPEHITIKNRELKISKYWSNNSKEDFKLGLKESSEKLDALLNDSIKHHMISDVPLGISLSGGIDSSAITHYAKKFSSKKLNTFTINYKDKDNPDFEFSNLISKKYDTKHHVVEVNDELQFKTK